MKYSIQFLQKRAISVCFAIFCIFTLTAFFFQPYLAESTETSTDLQAVDDHAFTASGIVSLSGSGHISPNPTSASNNVTNGHIVTICGGGSPCSVLGYINVSAHVGAGCESGSYYAKFYRNGSLLGQTAVVNTSSGGFSSGPSFTVVSGDNVQIKVYMNPDSPPKNPICETQSYFTATID